MSAHGGHKNPRPPEIGELFRVKNFYHEIHEVEAMLVPSIPPAFRVRTEHGARWLLHAKDDSIDACRWVGEPLPADPDAPEH